MQKCKESYATGKYVTQLWVLTRRLGPESADIQEEEEEKERKKLDIDLLIVPMEYTVSEMFASCISHKFTLIICIKTLE